MQQPAGRRDVVDMALQSGAIRTGEAVSRSKALAKLKLGDTIFRHLTRAAAIGVLIILSGVIFSLVAGSWPALREFGFGFWSASAGIRSPKTSARSRRSTARWSRRSSPC